MMTYTLTIISKACNKEYYLENCSQCQTIPYNQSITSFLPMKNSQEDFVRILTYFARMRISCLWLSSQNTSAPIKTALCEGFSMPGFLDVITPDNESAFISYVFKKSVKLELIQSVIITLHYLQANGQAERKVQTTKDVLK